MTFSENQVRQLYVVKKDPEAVTSASEVGTIKTKFDKTHETIWFEYMGAGGITASDKIKVANIVSAKAMKSTAMDKPLNKFKLTLDAGVQGAAGAEVVAGQDYLLRLSFRQYVGMSDEDPYWKYGMVHGMAGMTSSDFYKKLAHSLALNVARDENKLVKISVHSAAKGGENKNTVTGLGFTGGLMEVTPLTKDNGKSDTSNPYYVETTLVDDIDYILLEEVELPWVLGKIAVDKIPMEVQPTTITVGGDEVIWGQVSKEAPGKISNGKEIADLEYFCMGERGDQYRGMGYPNNIETKYLVDPAHNYDVLDITYFYAGDAEDVQKSQKVITLVADNAGGNKIMKAIITDVNAATANKPQIPANPEEH